MKIFEFRAQQTLPRPLDEVFSFFAQATNLEAITPPFLGFQIVTPLPIKMEVGTLIDYRLKIHGIPIRWRTRINVWQPPYRFEDEQLHGPYRQWIHEHTFEEISGGTLCHDRVRYAVLGGNLINRFFVRPDIETIFNHRRRCLDDLFQRPGKSHED